MEVEEQWIKNMLFYISTRIKRRGCHDEWVLNDHEVDSALLRVTKEITRDPERDANSARSGAVCVIGEGERELAPSREVGFAEPFEDDPKHVPSYEEVMRTSPTTVEGVAPGALMAMTLEEQRDVMDTTFDPWLKEVYPPKRAGLILGMLRQLDNVERIALTHSRQIFRRVAVIANATLEGAGFGEIDPFELTDE